MDDAKLEELEKAYRKEKNYRIRIRMLTVRMVRVRNMSVGETADTQTCYPTRICNRPLRYDDGGPHIPRSHQEVVPCRCPQAPRGGSLVHTFYNSPKPTRNQWAHRQTTCLTTLVPTWKKYSRSGQEGVETLADAYNESGCGTSIRQFIEVTKRHVDPESAELYLFPLTAAAIEYYLDGEGAQRKLLDSNLKPTDQKGNPVLLFKAERTRIVRVAGPIPRHRETVRTARPGGRDRARGARTNQ